MVAATHEGTYHHSHRLQRRCLRALNAHAHTVLADVDGHGALPARALRGRKPSRDPLLVHTNPPYTVARQPNTPAIL